jgi:hypothetical protein
LCVGIGILDVGYIMFDVTTYPHPKSWHQILCTASFMIIPSKSFIYPFEHEKYKMKILGFGRT